MALPDVKAFERAGLDAWPGIEVEWDGAWVLRSANGYTKRANSLQCLDPADGDDASARLDAACDWFTSRDLPPVVRTTPLSSPALNAALDARGWRTIGLSHLYAMPLGPQQPDPDSALLPLLDQDFLDAQQALQGHSSQTMDRMRDLLGAVKVPASGVVVYRDGKPAASGLMAIAEGIVITGNVITDPARRRQGLAGAMMRSGLAWAHKAGATVAALNVEADNAPAKALYRGLGYTHQYDYAYRVPEAL